MTPFAPTAEQQVAIAYPSDAVITACPGSGKTAVVTAKIQAVLVGLPDYQGVIGISYTNKASNELRRRCLKNGQALKRSFFGTIDGFCASEIVLPFVSHIIEGVGELSIKRFGSLPQEVREQFPADPRHLTQAEVHAALELVGKLCREGIVVLEMLASLAYYIMLASPACRTYLKARYKALFVDEYQDVSAVLHNLFLAIRELGIVTVVVGDVNQSVYGFDRRSSEFLKKLCEEGSGFQHFELTANIRCHPSIANYANRLLNPAYVLLPTQEIRVYRSTPEGTQRDVAAWICGHLEAVKKYFDISKNSDIAILVKSNHSADEVYKAMTVPAKVIQDLPMQQSNFLECQFYCMLLALRFDGRATIQSVLETFPAQRFTRRELARLRGAILSCRTVELAHLGDALVAAALLAGYTVSIDGITEMRGILASEEKLKLYRPIEDDQIQILTLHKSKGLEFDLVYHLDLHDWIIPKRIVVKGVFEPVFEDESQCLNLHYVGVTRARKASMLVASKQRANFSGEVKKGLPSQFFDRPGLDGLYVTS